jgi:hypothetical protein
MTIYLYVKQHKVTGLKYFGTTSKKDPYLYVGSGTHWRRHLKKHGFNIETTNVWKFEDADECEKFALRFSEENKIVESTEWANLRPENGRDGKPVGSPGMKREKNPNWGKFKEQNSFYGKKHKPETLEFLRKRAAAQPSGGNSVRAKRVSTPIGVFDCMKDAAKALEISEDTLRNRIKKGLPKYTYL